MPARNRPRSNVLSAVLRPLVPAKRLVGDDGTLHATPSSRLRPQICETDKGQNEPVSSSMIIWLVLIVCAAILLRFLLLRRGMLRAGRSPPQLPSGFATSEVENFIRERDEQAAPLQPDAGSAVHWFDGQRNTRTDVVVLFLHGWSASV